jgi:hypothetical protein
MVSIIKKKTIKSKYKMKNFKNIFKKNKWENIFSGEIKSKSGDGKLILQVERTKNKYRVLAYSGGLNYQVPLYKLTDTFPEVIPILKKEKII